MKTIIIGGGAARMMAAIAAARSGDQVLLLEQNEKLGKKIYITGKGRCNATNACETEDFFSHVRVNGKFLYSSFYGFTNRDLMDLLEENGCPLKVERGQRVFPVSDHASDVTKALKSAMTKAGVEVRLNAKVRELLISEGICQGVVLADQSREWGDKVIVCTGGLSYPSTGSTGDGYKFAKAAGHSLTPRSPGLVPLLTKENWTADLSGLSLKNVTLTAFRRGKEIYSELGEMLFTHKGISGPLVLTLSSLLDEQESYEVFIDLKPALTKEQLDQRILRDLGEAGKKQMKQAVGRLLPRSLIPVILHLAGTHEERLATELTKKEREALGGVIKALPLTVCGKADFSEAVITRGGVSVREVNPSTMESRKVKGLFFAGEVLDLDATTGGFNLQIAWSTGWAAGYHE